MIELLLLVGLGVAAFVGFNIGGSSTGVAFGPAVGSGVVSKTGAAALMTLFALLGGLTVGREVVATLGGELVPADLFTLTVSTVVLFFIGFALFVSNVVGVPASTSMTAVGGIAGLGLATGTLDFGKMSQIVGFWLVAPVVAFWLSAVVGRYLYPSLVERFAVGQTDGNLLAWRGRPFRSLPTAGPNTTRRELIGTVSVVVIGCYMAFSAGASNVANAIAPLVGSGTLTETNGILLAGVAIGVGAFTIARRTLDTMGNDLTDLPLLAALIVEVVSASIITALSAIGIPASFVVVATMSIVGLGWGRATRTTRLSETVAGESPGRGPVGALAAEAREETVPTAARAGADAPEGEPTTEVPPIGEENPEDLPATGDLFEPRRTARVIAMQNLVPVLATVCAYLVFRFVPIV